MTVLSTKRHVKAIRLLPRSAFALLLVSTVGIVAFGWPFLVDADSVLGHNRNTPWLFVAILPLLLGVLLAEMSEGGIDAKAVAVLGILAAVGAALRPLSTGTAGLEFVFVLLIPAGRVFGRGFGFLLGAVTLFASALLTGGVGPWLPFQMLGAAWMGFLAGCLPPAARRTEVIMLAAYGMVAGFGYGALLNLSFWPFATYLQPQLSFVSGAGVAENLQHYWAFYLTTSLGWDLTRGIGNAVAMLVIGPALLVAFRRAARRAVFAPPVRFEQVTAEQQAGR